MSLTWLLFTRSFRYNWKCFMLVAGAVGIGVAILLLFTAGYNGFAGRMNHTSWRQTISQTGTMSQLAVPGVQPLYAYRSFGPEFSGHWRDTSIDVTRLAASDATSPHFPGLPTPGPGEYYVSPSLKKAMDEHPQDNIGERFGTKLLGLMPDAYVASPDELAVVYGISISQAKRYEEQMARSGVQVPKLYRIDEQSTASLPSSYSDNILMAVLYLVVLIPLFPIVILISAAAQLGGSQRGQRYAALRLVGATKAQVRRIMLLESLAASAAGIAVGFVLYALARPLVLGFRFEHMFQDLRFWPHEVTVPAGEVIVIAATTLALTTIINWRAIRHVQASPLRVAQGSSRHGQPRWWRLVPLSLGLVCLALSLSLVLGRPQGPLIDIGMLLILASIILLMFGLVIAGPFIVLKLAGLIARHTRHAEILLGMKYISRNARSVFRSVAGVVAAMFVGSFLLALTSDTLNLGVQSIANDGFPRLQPGSALIETDVGYDPILKGQAGTFLGLGYIRSAHEIKKVEYSVSVMSCNVAVQYTSIRCPAGSNYVGINFGKYDLSKVLYGATEADVDQQLGSVRSNGGSTFDLPIVAPSYLVQIDDKDIDKLRSFLAAHYNTLDGSVSVFVKDSTSANMTSTSPVVEETAELARIGIGTTLFVAVIGLAISTVGGLLERRRSLVALRLSGMTVGGLKRVVLIESLIPLFSVTIVSAGLGLANYFALMHMVAPTIHHSIFSASYFLLLGGCIIGAIVIIASILPFVRVIADPEKMQTE